MTTLPIFQVDAFAEGLFTGNPAAVCPLERWLPDALMQQIAQENNLSETVFFVPVGKDGVDYHIRWFTPEAEVNLCGHATMAATHVMFECLGVSGNVIRLSSESSGQLSVTREGDRLILDFPAWPREAMEVDPALEKGLGVAIEELYRGPDWMAVVADAQAVRDLAPSLELIKTIPARGLIVTAPGEGEVDFVSRCFFPEVGVMEDPVTGSSHCMMTPYWAERFGKTELRARQLSKRQGLLLCRFDEAAKRVYLSGRSFLYLKGDIAV